MKTPLLFALCVAALLTDAPALAEGATGCVDAAENGQTLRDAHKFVEAREQLRSCAREQCPPAVRRDCVKWLAEVESSLPTMVITAKDGRGSPVVDVTVTVEGKVLVTQLNGLAIPMNPGLHTLHFRSADGVTLDQRVVVKEGERNQVVAVVLDSPPPPPSERPPPVVPKAESTPESRGSSTPPSGSGARTAGWITAGAGVATLGVAAYFGIRTLSLKSDRDAICAPGVPCTSQEAFDDDHQARIDQLVALVLTGVGAAAVGVGAWLVLSSPRAATASPGRAAARLRLVPHVGPAGAGMSMQARW
jgi:hypothetical protein